MNEPQPVRCSNCTFRKCSLGNVAILAGLALFVLAACSKPTTPTLQPEPGKSSQSPMVPAYLEALGAHAENLYDMAKRNEWPKAASEYASLGEAARQMQATQPGPEAGTDLKAAIASLERSVRVQDRLASMQEANQITRIAASLSRPFQPAVPVEVTLLDYFGRELEIWAMRKNGAKLRSTTREMQQTWAVLRPQVMSRAGETGVKKFDDLMSQIEGAKSPAQFGPLALAALDEVDNLEGVFKKK